MTISKEERNLYIGRKANMNIINEKEAKQVELMAYILLDAVDDWNHREDIQCACGNWITNHNSPKGLDPYKKFCSTCKVDIHKAIENTRSYLK